MPQAWCARAFAAALALALALPAADAAWAADEVGQVSRLQGQAAAFRNGVWRELRLLSRVRAAERLATGPEARLELALDDGTLLTLGAEAQLTLDEFVYQPGGADNRIEATVVGAFRFVSGKLQNSAARQARIQTPVAVLGIRGTDFWGGPLDRRYGVLLLEGRVEVATPAGSVLLQSPGEGTDIDAPGAPPGPVIRWGQAKVDRAIATISFR